MYLVNDITNVQLVSISEGLIILLICEIFAP
jgi:hypothetical protein